MLDNVGTSSGKCGYGLSLFTTSAHWEPHTTFIQIMSVNCISKPLLFNNMNALQSGFAQNRGHWLFAQNAKTERTRDPKYLTKTYILLEQISWIARMDIYIYIYIATFTYSRCASRKNIYPTKTSHAASLSNFTQRNTLQTSDPNTKLKHDIPHPNCTCQFAWRCNTFFFIQRTKFVLPLTPRSPQQHTWGFLTFSCDNAARNGIRVTTTQPATAYDEVLQSTRTIPYYKVLLQNYSVLQSTTSVLVRTTKYYSSTTPYCKVYSNTTPYYKVLLQYYSSTTPYYKVLLQYYKVLLQNYSVLPSTTPVLQSTIPVLPYYKVLLQY